jgi:hypothetical protein
MITVTSVPKVRKFFSNSTAIIPDPVIAIDFGKNCNVLILSESRILIPSNGIPFGKNGFEPVQIKVLLVFTYVTVPSSASNRKVIGVADVTVALLSLFVAVGDDGGQKETKPNWYAICYIILL